jgi:signal transduction histidine kinase
MKPSRLASLERAALLEELASTIRHDLRNRLAAIKNASFYLKTKTRASTLWQSDKNVARFYQVIEDEIAAAGDLIAKHLMQSNVFAAEVGPVSLRTCVEEALVLAHLPSSIAVEPAFEDAATIEADRVEIVLLARCLIDHAAERLPRGSGTLRLRTWTRGAEVILQIGESDEPPAEEEDLPMSLKIVRRIAARYGGTFALPLVSFPTTPSPR